MQALLTGQHMPDLTPTPKAGTFDKVLSGIGLAGAFGGALMPKPSVAPIPPIMGANPSVEKRG
jgi:hypothetical protein